MWRLLHLRGPSLRAFPRHSRFVCNKGNILKRLNCFFVATVVASAAWAQAPQDSASATAPVADIEAPVYALLSDTALADSTKSRICLPTGNMKVLPDVMVVVVRKFDCKAEYPSAPTVALAEVLYNGETAYVKAEDIFTKAENEKRLATFTPEVVDANRQRWKTASEESYQFARGNAIDAVKKTASQGIALLKHSVYDVSEHTEGTGFEVSVLNTGKKTIKYITFNMVGLNAVDDPVRDRIRGGTTVSLRGVGPIEPSSTAGYSKDYMWTTDLVESHRLTSIRLEYMDGTSKTLANLKALELPLKHVRVLDLD